MCGIAGILDYTHGASVETVETVDRMLGAQVHRGPDDRGVWRSDDGICALGNNRLAVMDLSPAGHQPMIDEITGNVIVFNGEIFNFNSLRDRLLAAGVRFRSHSDTEVILALYREHGEACVRMLRGMFAFAIWDARAHHLLVARDRMGEKPLVYSEAGGAFTFASELGPLMRNESIPDVEDPEALDLFLQLEYIPAPWTIYRSVRKFPPAHYAVVDANGIRLRRYWELSYEPTAMSEADALDGLEEKLFEAVRGRMVADVAVGTTLSGGVDSSLVTAIMSRISERPVKTYNVAMESGSFDESRFARMVADACGTEHVSEVLAPDVGQLLPVIARHYGEPYADKGCVPAFFISRVARQGVTVALDGDGGDELLGGYPMYRLSPLAQRIANRTWPRGSASRLAGSVASLQDDEHFIAQARRRLTSRYLHPELVPLLYVAFWGDRRRTALLGDAATTAVDRWRREMLEGADAHASDVVDRMLWIQNHSYLPYDGLVKMDIASMHCSLEVRTPLVDHEVVEFCASMPSSVKVKGGVAKHPLKAIAEKYVPREVLYRRKQGFAIPVGEWLAGELRHCLDDVLTDRDLMAPFNAVVVDSTRRAFLAGAKHHESRLWALLMYGLWRRHRGDNW